MSGPILAVDPGEVRLGLALSDEQRVVARPLQILRHQSLAQDSLAIAEKAARYGAVMILIGLALDAEGHVGPQARKGLRLAEAVRTQTSIPVETWDESGSTYAAKEIAPRAREQDARAAAVFLQDYLNAQQI